MDSDKKGVAWYTKATIAPDYTVSFPEGETICRYCDFIRYYEPTKLYRCMLTDEIIMQPFSPNRGRKCPLIFEKTDF